MSDKKIQEFGEAAPTGVEQDKKPENVRRILKSKIKEMEDKKDAYIKEGDTERASILTRQIGEMRTVLKNFQEDTKKMHTDVVGKMEKILSNKPDSNPGSGNPNPNTVPGSDVGGATGTGSLSGGEVTGGSFGPTTPGDTVTGGVSTGSSGGF